MAKVSIKTRVMDFVAANGGVTTFSEVQKFIVEQVRGWKYNRSYRGYFVGAFVYEATCPLDRQSNKTFRIFPQTWSRKKVFRKTT